MRPYTHFLMLFVAVANIAVADPLIKKAAETNRLMGALSTLWMTGAIVLYLL